MMIERDSDGVLHVVALSGGDDSSCLAVKLQEIEPRPYCYVCTPTGDELPEMFAHWNRLGERLGRRLIPIMEGRSLFDYSRYQSAIPNRKQRHCTRGLKILPFQRWIKEQLKEGPVVCYVGLRADEEGRAGGSYDAIDGISIRYPLREWGMSDPDVLAFLEQRNIIIPRRTDCARCYAQQIGEWWILWLEHRSLFLEAIEFEKEMGNTFRTPKLNDDGSPVMVTRYGMTFAASWRDTWPVRLADMAAVFEAGNIPTNGKNDPRVRDLFRSGECRVCSL